MKRLLLLLIAGTMPVLAADQVNWNDPFDNPVAGFTEALMPIMNSRFKAEIVKTMRGFNARADDSSQKMEAEEPSDRGLALCVMVRDSEEVNGFSDTSEKHGAITERMVRIPPPGKDKQALVIVLQYGKEAPAEAMAALDKCIARIVGNAMPPKKP